MSPSRAVVVLEQARVSPPPGSVLTTSLPLAFFDMLWYLCCPMQRLFFFRFPLSTRHFSHALLPSLKHSLSLTLRHFFPLAGTLVCLPPPANPHILFTAGDSIPFTAAESTAEIDFDDLAGDHPQNVLRLHPYAPSLPPARVSGEVRAFPLMAVQATVFPGAGVVLGVTFCHVAADGRSFHHFMKSWAECCKAGGDRTVLNESIPFHDRDSMKILDLFKVDLVKDLWVWASDREMISPGPATVLLTNKVRATFLVGRAQIEGLKQRVATELGSGRNSAFVVTLALAWACLVRSEVAESESSKEDESHSILFAADCRNRLDFPIPSTYFGNCLAFSTASVKRSELIGARGVTEAAKALGHKVNELESGAMEGAEMWMRKFKEAAETGRLRTVAGSPKLGVYETDFGFGKPMKTELVHTDVSGAISLCDHREEERGIEVSLALAAPRMRLFSQLFVENLAQQVI